MSNRLNKTMREELCALMIAQRFDAERELLKTRSLALADQSYDLLSAGVDKAAGVKGVLGKLPEWCVDMNNTVFIEYMPGQRYVGRVNGRPQWTGASRSRVMSGDKPCVWSNTGEVLELLLPLKKEWLDLARDEQNHETAREEAGKKIMGVLRAFTTVKRLEEQWPEAAALLPESEVNYEMVPVGQIGQINRDMGLEPTQANA